MAAGRDLVRRQERAAALRANAENLKVVAGDYLRPHLAPGAASAQIGFERAGAEEAQKRLIVIAKVLVVGIRHADIASGASFAVDDRQPRGPRHAGNRAEGPAFQTPANPG